MITAVFKQILSLNGTGLFYILVIIAVMCDNRNAAASVPIKLSDTTGQTKINALNAADKLLYALSIDSGKFIKGICDPEQLVYQVTATLNNNSKDTLTYLDRSNDPQIWFIDKGRIKVVPSDFYPCNGSVSANDLIFHQLLPRQSVKIDLNIIVNGDVSLINQKFKIGVLLQRVFKKSDYVYYGMYFDFSPQPHELSDQTINLIWSNTLIMKR